MRMDGGTGISWSLTPNNAMQRTASRGPAPAVSRPLIASVRAHVPPHGTPRCYRCRTDFPRSDYSIAIRINAAMARLPPAWRRGHRQKILGAHGRLRGLLLVQRSPIRPRNAIREGVGFTSGEATR